MLKELKPKIQMKRQIHAQRVLAHIWLVIGMLALPCSGQVAQWAKSGIIGYPRSIAVAPQGGLSVYYNADYNGVGRLLTFGTSGDITATNDFGDLAIGKLTWDATGTLHLVGNRTVTNDTGEATALFTVVKQGTEGATIWERKWDLAGAPPTYGKAIAVDAQGSVYVGGEVRHADSGGQYYPGNGDGFFVRKYDKNGQLLWTHQVAHQNVGRYFGAFLYDLAVDPAGNVVFCGFLSEGTTDFGGQTVYPDSTGHGYNGDFYLSKLKPNGDLDWVQLGYAVALAAGPQGEIYASFDWAKDGKNGVARLDPMGALVWSRTISGIYMARTQGALAVSPSNKIVFTGQLYATANFGSVTLRPRNTSYEDFFIAVLDSDGSPQWAMSGGGSNWDAGSCVACDHQDSVYLAGTFRLSGSLDGLTLIGGPRPDPNIIPATLFVTRILTSHPLTASMSNQKVTLTWPARATNYVLEASSTAVPNSSWFPVMGSPTITGRDATLTLEATNSSQFFRLRKQ